MDAQQAEQKLTNLTWMVSAAVGFVLIFVISMTALMLWQATRVGATSAEVKQLAEESHQSLCAFKGDLQARYDDSAKILQEHAEDPVRIYGLIVPRDQLVQAQQGRKATLDSLSGLDCS